eukprot:333685-Rhodomonas_salina.3
MEGCRRRVAEWSEALGEEERGEVLLVLERKLRMCALPPSVPAPPPRCLPAPSQATRTASD